MERKECSSFCRTASVKIIWIEKPFGDCLVPHYNYQWFFSIRNDNLPVHFIPFPVYPGLHVQLKDPSVLLQKALTSQLWALVVHSLMSEWREKNALAFADRLL